MDKDKKQEDSILTHFKKIVKEKWYVYIGIIVFVLILIPVGIDKIIFANAIPSNVDNKDWAAFLGSYLGGIIGAVIAGIVTLFSVIFTIEHNEQQARKDRYETEKRDLNNQIKNIMPYIQLEVVGAGGSVQDTFILDNIFRSQNNYQGFVLNIAFTNIGSDSAVNISCMLDYNPFNGAKDKKDIFNNKRSLAKGEKLNTKNVWITQYDKILNKYKITILFDDLMGNKYSQDLYIEGEGYFVNINKIEYYSDVPKLLYSQTLYQLNKYNGIKDSF